MLREVEVIIRSRECSHINRCFLQDICDSADLHSLIPLFKCDLENVCIAIIAHLQSAWRRPLWNFNIALDAGLR